MPVTSSFLAPRLSRRFVVSALLATTALAGGRRAMAQEQDAAPAPFSFEQLTERARARAAESYHPPETIAGPIAKLDYDIYRRIVYDPAQSKWAGEKSLYRVQAFHLGWLFDAPVGMFEIVEGTARPMTFSPGDFKYHDGAREAVGGGTEFPGVAGFRLTFPLNRPNLFDELVAFQGASYFRALGQGSAYGLSARGLAIDTGLPDGEEFPRFSAFYLERPAPGQRTVTIYADLDSPSVAGAYRFVITPGGETRMDVTARLFFREGIGQLGVAPLTSMFLYDETNRTRFDDYRPQVHDSNGLQIVRAGGDRLWRHLANPPQLANSYFAETSPEGFGLRQRDRAFASYQDPGARYHERPSLMVEPIGDWGRGAVRLVELPTDLEINDNIVAFWVPEAEIEAGAEREFRYLLRWGDLPLSEQATQAHVHRTATGEGGVSGTEKGKDARKFVVDFKGGDLGRLPADAKVEPMATVAGGEIVDQALSKLPDSDVWRFVADVRPTGERVIELVAYVAGYQQRLSETWLYQWIQSK